MGSRIYPGNFRTWHELLTNGFNSAGKFEVQISDQTSPTVFVYLHKALGAAVNLTGDAAIGDTTITVDSVTGFAVGKGIAITDGTNHRYYSGHITAINTLTLTLDTPLDFAYTIATSKVTPTDHDMQVDGSVTPQTFSFRAAEPADDPVNLTADITQIIIAMSCSSAVDLVKFGNLTALTNGIVLRQTDGTVYNIINAKDNFDLVSVAYESQIFAASNPSQGLDGIVVRMKFAGSSEQGVAIRVGPGEDLECIIQDNLSTLTKFNIMVKGHVVVD